MLVCPKCNHQQDSGKFCGVCGTAVQAADSEQLPNDNVEEEVRSGSPEQDIQSEGAASTSQTAATAEPQVQETSEVIKNGLSQYWSYFLTMVKNPSRAFDANENQFVNGLVTLGLYAVIFSLSLYFLANSLMRAFNNWFDTSVPFFDVNARLVFVAIIFFVITFGSAFIMIKIAKNQQSFKTIIAQYGSIVVPFTALNVIAMIGGLIGSIQLTMSSIFLSASLTFVFIPVLFVYEKVSSSNRSNQKIYLSLATILLITLISYILHDALIVNLIEEIEYLF